MGVYGFNGATAFWLWKGRRSVSWQQLVGGSFNGATAFWLWKVEVYQPQAQDRRRFNGATAFWLWKGRASKALGAKGSQQTLREVPKLEG